MGHEIEYNHIGDEEQEQPTDFHHQDEIVYSMQHDGNQDSLGQIGDSHLFIHAGNPQVITHGDTEDGMGRYCGKGPDQGGLHPAFHHIKHILHPGKTQ